MTYCTFINTRNEHVISISKPFQFIVLEYILIHTLRIIKSAHCSSEYKPVLLLFTNSNPTITTNSDVVRTTIVIIFAEFVAAAFYCFFTAFGVVRVPKFQ